MTKIGRYQSNICVTKCNESANIYVRKPPKAKKKVLAYISWIKTSDRILGKDVPKKGRQPLKGRSSWWVKTGHPFPGDSQVNRRKRIRNHSDKEKRELWKKERQTMDSKTYVDLFERGNEMSPKY